MLSEPVWLPVNRGTFATVKEGTNKETKSRVAIKIIDKKDAVFDAESLAQEVCFDLNNTKTFFFVLFRLLRNFRALHVSYIFI